MGNLKPKITEEFVYDRLVEAFADDNKRVIKMTIEGPHGIGKTAIVLSAIDRFMEKYGRKIKFAPYSVPTLDPIHASGLPEIITKDNGDRTVKFIPADEIMEAEILFFDEFTRPIGPEVTNALFELINQGTVNGVKCAAKIIIAAYNPGDTEGYDTLPLDPALADRFHFHFTMDHLPKPEVVSNLIEEVVPECEYTDEVAELVCAFAQEHDHERTHPKTTNAEDALNYISPRQWVRIIINWLLFHGSGEGKGLEIINASFSDLNGAQTALNGQWDERLEQLHLAHQSPEGLSRLADPRNYLKKKIVIPESIEFGEATFTIADTSTSAALSATDAIVDFGGIVSTIERNNYDTLIARLRYYLAGKSDDSGMEHLSFNKTNTDLQDLCRKTLSRLESVADIFSNFLDSTPGIEDLFSSKHRVHLVQEESGEQNEIPLSTILDVFLPIGVSPHMQAIADSDDSRVDDLKRIIENTKSTFENYCGADEDPAETPTDWLVKIINSYSECGERFPFNMNKKTTPANFIRHYEEMFSANGQKVTVDQDDEAFSLLSCLMKVEDALSGIAFMWDKNPADLLELPDTCVNEAHMAEYAFAKTVLGEWLDAFGALVSQSSALALFPTINAISSI